MPTFSFFFPDLPMVFSAMLMCVVCEFVLRLQTNDSDSTPRDPLLILGFHCDFGTERVDP